MTRTEVTDLIIAAKHKKGLKWADIAKKVGQSKEWTTAALLGQMTLDKKQAATVGKLLGLPPEAVAELHPLHRADGEQGGAEAGLQLVEHGVAEPGGHALGPDLHHPAHTPP